MMSMLRWLLLPAAVALLAFVVACNGDDNNDDTDDGGTTPGVTATPGDGNDNGDGDGGNSELRRIADRFESATFRATYSFTSSGEEPIEGEMVLYKDGADRFRFDVTDDRTEQGALIFIETADSTLLCLADAAELGQLLGVEEGEGVCLQTGGEEDTSPVAGLSGIFTDIQDADADVVEESQRRIAGEQARCFTTEEQETTEEFCFADNGMLLYFRSEGPGGEVVEMEARSFTEDVDADVFEPPYEVREFPGMGGN